MSKTAKAGQLQTRPIPRSAAILTIVVLLCAGMASVATLAWQGSFPNLTRVPGVNSVLAEARGWSAATLLVAIPLSAVSLGAAGRGSLRGHLAWAGSLAYFVYTYLEFAVSPPFTALYLVYIIAFACAIPALMMSMASIDVGALPGALGERPTRRLVAIFSLLIAALLTLAWLRGSQKELPCQNPTNASSVDHA